MPYPLDADARSGTIRSVPLPALGRLPLCFQGGLGKRKPMQDTYRATAKPNEKGQTEDSSGLLPQGWWAVRGSNSRP